MTDEQYLLEQQRVSDLADKLLAERIAEGTPFSHGLCEWALNEAERRMGIAIHRRSVWCGVQYLTHGVLSRLRSRKR